MNLKIATIALALAAAAPASAQAVNDKQLLDMCNADRGTCNAYITELYDGLALHNEGKAYCVPRTVTYREISDKVIDAVTEMLTTHPEWKNESATHAVASVLVGAYPCKTGKAK
jgi:hypothetical protein